MRVSRRTGRLALLVLVVTALHLWLVGEVLPARLGEGDRNRMPKPIEVAFVSELAPVAPPARPPVAAPVPRRADRSAPAVAPSPSNAASAAEADERQQQDAARAAALAASAAEAERRQAEQLAAAAAAEAASAAAASQVAAAASAAVAASAAAASVVATAASAPPSEAFEWPPSTRLTYNLTGYYLGPVQGQAVVEWVRQGSRYQVRMDTNLGPLLGRKAVSSGDISDKGLRPMRYDEETRVMFRETRREAVVFDDDAIHLANGTEVPRYPGVQDTVSQFVQLTWLFTTQPDRLQTGNTVVFPVAFTRRVEPWTYEVLGEEMLPTPAGPVNTFHVKPRREGKTNALIPEFWVAPSLQYLPVRMVIRQDAQTFIDLLIDRLPVQAERSR